MVTIPAQFNGPDHSGNGGYVAGLIADQVGAGPTTSTLRIPPPLDVPLTWERDSQHPEGGIVRLLTAGGAVVGEAAPGRFTRAVPAAPTPAEAAAGLAAYPGFNDHPFERCSAGLPASSTYRSRGQRWIAPVAGLPTSRDRPWCWAA
jgi:hypothetical protein